MHMSAHIVFGSQLSMAKCKRKSRMCRPPKFYEPKGPKLAMVCHERGQITYALLSLDKNNTVDVILSIMLYTAKENHHLHPAPLNQLTNYPNPRRSRNMDVCVCLFFNIYIYIYIYMRVCLCSDGDFKIQ